MSKSQNDGTSLSEKIAVKGLEMKQRKVYELIGFTKGVTSEEL